MNPTGTKRANWFHVRAGFLLAGASLAATLALPGLIRSSHALKMLFLLLAALALGLGWFFLLRERKPNSSGRASIAFVTSVYLTLSLPVFLFEMSQWRWLVRHPLRRVFSIYVWPWAHWGYGGLIQVFLGVVGSFFGHGRARIAFVTGSVLLMILWASTGDWVL